ncbi:AraC family transcriptional regulator [Antarctobacter sp.]|uniref:AraC family transcriptional regulator n=1 Tax=Antarctobacter sp. TaxID=1872577 RepID=UPI002B267226|nr:AraC family transcriptional regulator [Antarctobacter sp.]
MRPWFEAVTIPDGHSCLIYDRRLPEFAFNWHYHPEYELTLTLGSHGTRFVASDVAPYADGDLALIGPNVPHAWQSHRLAEGATEHRAIVCWFTDAWIRTLLDLMPELGVIGPLLREAQNGLLFGADTSTAMKARMLRLCDQPQPDRALGLVHLLLALARAKDRTTLSPGAITPSDMPRDRRRMERVLAHVHAQFDAPIRLAPLCEIANVTESQLQRIFKRSTGLSVSEYVTRLRVGRASTLLSRSDLPMADIAEKCGFHDAAYFARKFRATTGRSPTAYRREFQSSGPALPIGAFPMRSDRTE